MREDLRLPRPVFQKPAAFFPEEMREAAQMLIRAYGFNHFTARNLAMRLSDLADHGPDATMRETLRVSEVNWAFQKKLVDKFERSGLLTRLWMAIRGTL